MTIPGYSKKQGPLAEVEYIDPSVMSKTKAWNWLKANGFKECVNKNYLAGHGFIAHKNRLLPYVILEQGGSQ